MDNIMKDVLVQATKDRAAAAKKDKAEMVIKYPKKCKIKVITGKGDTLMGRTYGKEYTVLTHKTYGRKCYMMVKEEANLGFVDSQIERI